LRPVSAAPQPRPNFICGLVSPETATIQREKRNSGRALRTVRSIRPGTGSARQTWAAWRRQGNAITRAGGQAPAPLAFLRLLGDDGGLVGREAHHAPGPRLPPAPCILHT
jgi:hypothetical protein